MTVASEVHYKQYEGLIRKVFKDRSVHHQDWDMWQEAQNAVREAIADYDPARGMDISGHVYNRIRYAVLDEFNKRKRLTPPRATRLKEDITTDVKRYHSSSIEDVEEVDRLLGLVDEDAARFLRRYVESTAGVAGAEWGLCSNQSKGRFKKEVNRIRKKLKLPAKTRIA